jgi:hypothetical protein
MKNWESPWIGSGYKNEMAGMVGTQLEWTKEELLKKSLKVNQKGEEK